MRKIIFIITTLFMLQGCAVAVVAGATGVVSSANDRRTIGSQIDDNSIEIKATLEIQGNKQLEKYSNISVISLNGIVLLLGQSPTEEMKSQAQKLIKNIPAVKKIHNQIRISSNVGITTKTFDTWLTSKVKTMLLTDETVSGNNIKVVTENGEVFLMGLVQQSEGQKAVDIARNISGVAKVIKVFEYL
ncbi:division/outer membrane stress-associated lipid-binding lipoprotein [Pseudoalteromonas denitrificans]|uniref:Osmotically-inducible protein OsmY, contains BON domain n=1 Tax=Pseudoalteromonas denitrificans DSM 6059 TaxID=1123010 RepID=A0A1I1K1N4_9GAMM|nr:division/outer membrane stress-associated lipid-binding lipoprotein [Pseudoalteromonas denitrificans]SFC54754.1 Osmotically-inducible protein OsmY, contains BON domain [Pseudoalteromonas denitrificans DSM 6059]